MHASNGTMRKTSVAKYVKKKPIASAPQPQVVTTYKEVNILTDVDILVAGHHYAGFDTRRQGKVNLNRNMIRYK
jgi:hypothetical protein